MSHNITYNTQFSKLVFKEYGRNLQQMVEYCKEIDDRAKRNEMAQLIVNLMGQMHPHLRNIEEFRQKLWHQLHAIANFDLDVDSPYPQPKPEEVWQRPAPLTYPRNKIRFKHYGKNIEILIKKAIDAKDTYTRNCLAKVTAHYMKMVFKNWNKEAVSDDIVVNDLYTLSDGLLDLRGEDNIEMPRSGRVMPPKKRRVQNNYRDRDRDVREYNRGGYSSKHRNNHHYR